MQASLAPTQAAFEVVFPRAELLNLLDDTLSRDVQQPHDDESLSARFEALARYALLSGADAVLFTCSAFGGQIERVQRLDTLRSVPVLKPNEALQRQIIASGGTVAIVSMFKPTLVSILRELRELWEGTEGAPPFVPIEVHVPGALDALNRGERHKCAESIAAAVVNVLGGCAELECVALAMFSMAFARGVVEAELKRIFPSRSIRLLTSPESAVHELREQLRERLDPSRYEN